MTPSEVDSDRRVPTILMVHPNCELYGSDRTFIQAVHTVRARWPQAELTIVLPQEGVLAEVLRQTELNVRAEALFVPRRAKIWQTVLSLPRLTARVLHARRQMAQHDLTYINTLVLLDYVVASRFSRRACLIHVHEMPTGVERRVFGLLLAIARARFIFISEAVRSSFPELAQRPSEVVWNGVRDFAVTGLPAPNGPLRLLLIGRFNAWKGQSLLLDAITLLRPEERRQISVRLVGSTFEGADHFAEAITAKVKADRLHDVVEICGFDPEPDSHYQWAHVVAVPSTKPEPFGLVAIEAMASGRAVIAADHGGLSEIVDDGKTGTLVTPGNALALAEAIRRYLKDRVLVAQHGTAGRARHEREFRESIHKRRLLAAVEHAVADARK